jgi:ubiquinone/menaquinone biosynthesis C-methylase UbiE
MAGSSNMGHPIAAAFQDIAMWPLRNLRKKVVGRARGRVLEIGVGTGLNLQLYREIESLDGIEPDPYMLKRARARTGGLPYPIELKQAGAEALPYEADIFDTVLATWVLCTIPEPEAALSEMYRVLKPGGQLIYAEHTRSRFPRAARLQSRLNPLWKKLSAGCHLDRTPYEMIVAAGFDDATIKPCGREDWTLLPVYRGLAHKHG